jgi:hypothetical protein
VNIDIDEQFVRNRLQGFFEKTNVRNFLIWLIDYDLV